MSSLRHKGYAMGVATAICGLFTTINYFAILQTMKKHDSIASKPEFSTSESIVFLSSQFDEVKRILADSKQNPKQNPIDKTRLARLTQLSEKEIYYEKLLVKGISSCKNPLESRIDKQETSDEKKVNLIYRLNQYHKRFSNDSIIRTFSQDSPNKNSLLISSECVPMFTLTDPTSASASQPPASVEVFIQDKPIFCSSSLNHSDNMRTDRQLSAFQKIRSTISYTINLFSAIFSKNSTRNLNKGIEIGFSEHEIGIATGGSLAILGDVIFNIEDRTLRMVNPILFIGEKSRYLTRLLKEKREQQILFYILAGVTSIFSVLLVRQIYTDYKQEKEHPQLLANQRSDTLSKISHVYVKKVNDMKCDECNNKDKQVVFKPCGHLTTCQDCSNAHKSCPVCGASIEESIVIYNS